jgi:hypothetical protein
MIMQGKTPRSLSWLGGCAVLGLGLLLPVVPLRAQARPEAEPPVRPARQEKIEILKRAIKILEEQEAESRRDKTASDKLARTTVEIDKAKAAEIAKAKAEAEAAATLYKTKMDEAKRAHAMLQEALARLSKLTGKPMPTPHTAVDPNRPMTAPRGGLGVGGPFGPPNRGFGAPMGPRAGPWVARPADKDGSALEKKLDRLLKEVDELRRELRGRKPQAGPDPAPRRERPRGDEDPFTPAR